MIKQLCEVGALLGLDCGDNSCYFKAHEGGMRTNGGCRCDLPTRIREEREARAELDVAVEELCSFAERAARLLDSHARQCLPMVIENGDRVFEAAQRVRGLMKKAGK